MHALFKQKKIERDSDNPLIVASHLYDLHGYKKALNIVGHYIDDARAYPLRLEWQCVAKELAQIATRSLQLKRLH